MIKMRSNAFLTYLRIVFHMVFVYLTYIKILYIVYYLKFIKF